MQWSEPDSGDGAGSALIPSANAYERCDGGSRARPLVNALVDALSTSLTNTVPHNGDYGLSASRSSGSGTVAKPMAASEIPYGSTRVSACTSAPQE